MPDYTLVGCWIADGYEVAGLSPVFVVRKNPKNDTLIIASFMCDIFCLGVKDVLFETYANVDRLDFLLNMQSQDMVAIDYEIAREVILGSVKYAEEIGFSPHPTYNTAKYTVEYDKPFTYNKDAFGMGGQPFYVTGPNDDYKQVLATLERIAGKGNFDYYIDERSGFIYVD